MRKKSRIKGIFKFNYILQTERKGQRMIFTLSVLAFFVSIDLFYDNIVLPKPMQKHL